MIKRIQVYKLLLKGRDGHISTGYQIFIREGIENVIKSFFTSDVKNLEVAAKNYRTTLDKIFIESKYSYFIKEK